MVGRYILLAIIEIAALRQVERLVIETVTSTLCTYSHGDRSARQFKVAHWYLTVQYDVHCVHIGIRLTTQHLCGEDRIGYSLAVGIGIKHVIADRERAETGISV